ncbi:response regulator transcription factor [Microbacterium sp.]|uniref:response regulator transcription factor n=1 Tax=Microbacterium sp. TaxID=51671 RepID=UPI002811DB63|nr:response regulator transcription factor [Microbacterium sp.]
MTQIRVVIADDDPLVRTALAQFLSRGPDLSVVAQAEDGASAVAAVAEHRPDVVMMDVQMPGMNGIDATAEIGARWPSVRVLAVTTFETPETILPMLRAGAAGYVLKDSSVNEILDGVRHVHEGASSLSPRVAAMLIDHMKKDSSAATSPPPPLEKLTDREADVLQKLARGMSNAEIADALIVSEGTVKAHLGRIMAKWHVRDRVQILIAASKAGLVDLR